VAFKNGWNNHGIRTEHGRSPQQLFVSGALWLWQSGMTVLDFFENVGDEQYGVEEEELVADEENSTVVIPENQFQWTNEQLLLQQQINPLAESENHAIELYERTLEYIMSL